MRPRFHQAGDTVGDFPGCELALELAFFLIHRRRFNGCWQPLDVESDGLGGLWEL